MSYHVGVSFRIWNANYLNLAYETVELLRSQLSDQVGELCLARDRVTTLEELLGKDRERVDTVVHAIHEVKKEFNGKLEQFNGRFEHIEIGYNILQDTGKKILEQGKVVEMGNNTLQDTSKKILEQGNAVTKSLHSVVKTRTEAEVMVNKVHCLENLLKHSCNDLRQVEKRTRRAIQSSGYKVVEKVTEARVGLHDQLQAEVEDLTKKYSP